ncbi:hypothetical protein TIFTF001_029128 [Ficus carica]|uniref:Transposase MuDR plant domain-containing protein n=1 Tax=Ficus carica TaxID=3494 RepID=A0AA88DRC2_FICCA|nr:hypothetical protein TIFTF001_029128 [Ficus carica]
MFGKYGNCSKGLHGESSMSSAGLSWFGDADVDIDMDWHLVDDCDVGKILLSFDIKERNEFPSKSVLKKYMHFIAIRGNFEFKVDRSNADFYVLSCIADGCTWMVHASMISGRDIWVIRNYVYLHTCSRDVVSNEHRRASSQFVGELLKHDFSLGINERARPRDVMALMCGKHGLVYPAAVEHGICIQHLLRNLIGRFKGLKVDGLFYRCVKIYQPEDFEYFMRQMESVRPEIWQNVYEVGKYPVLSLVESCSSLLQRWFYERRNQADENHTHLTARADCRLRDMEAAARPMDVHPIDVNDDEFPCSHAVTASWKRKLEPAEFAYVYFRNSYRETYNSVVYPLGDKSSWNVLEDLLNAGVRAPNNRCFAGRPRMERIPSVGEVRTQLRCSKCNNFGHNKCTCKNRVPSAKGAPSSKKMKSCRQRPN